MWQAERLDKGKGRGKEEKRGIIKEAVEVGLGSECMEVRS